MSKQGLSRTVRCPAFEQCEPRLLLDGNDFSAGVDWLYYQDGAGREIRYDFSSGVMQNDGTIPIPDAAVVGRAAGEVGTTFLWESLSGNQEVGLAGGTYTVAVPQPIDAMKFIPTANITVNGSVSDWNNVPTYNDDADDELLGSAPSGSNIDYVKLAYSTDYAKLNILIKLTADANPAVQYTLFLNEQMHTGYEDWDYRIDIQNPSSVWDVTSQGLDREWNPYAIDEKGVVRVSGQFIEASVQAGMLGLPGQVDVWGRTSQAGDSLVYDEFSNNYMESNGLSALGASGSTGPASDAWTVGARIGNFSNCSEAAQSYHGVYVGTDNWEGSAVTAAGCVGWFTGLHNGVWYDNLLLLEGEEVWVTEGEGYEWWSDIDAGEGLALQGYDPSDTVVDLAVEVTDAGQTATFYYRINSDSPDQGGAGWSQYATHTLPQGVGTMTAFPDAYPMVRLEAEAAAAHGEPGLPGTWAIASKHGRGTMTFDDDGEFVSGSFTTVDGTSVNFTDADYELSNDGTLGVYLTTDDPNKPNTELVGALNASGDVMSLTDAQRPVPAGEEDLSVLVKHTATFSNADTAGAWVFTAADLNGSLVCNNLGNVLSGSYVEYNSDGSGSVSHGRITGGAFIVAADGTLTLSLNTPDAEDPVQNMRGAMNDSKDAVVLTEDPLPTEGTNLLVCTRHTGAFSAADLSGRWSVLSDGANGSLVLNGMGKVTGGWYVTGAGEQYTITGGTYSVTRDGKVNATLTSNEPDAGKSKWTGTLNTSKDVLALTGTENSLLVFTNSASTDLVGEFGVVTLPEPMVPGDRGLVPVIVRNMGQVPAIGKVTINLYASPDRIIHAGDVLMGTLADQSVNLGMSKSRTFTFNQTIASNMPPGTYYLLAEIVPGAGIREVARYNNVAATDGPGEVVWKFGNVDGRRNVRLPLTDGDGTLVGFSLAGLGTGEVVSGPGGWNLTFIGTDANSGATITATKSRTLGDDGRAALHDITVNGSLKSLSLSTTNLTGDMSVQNTLGTLLLGSVLGSQNTLTINGAGTAKTAVTMTFDRVAHLSISAPQMPIKSIAATEWLDLVPGDVITTPGLGSLNIRGRAGVAAGDFMADLNLTDAAVFTTPTNITVAGTLKHSNIRAAGSLGVVSVGAMEDSNVFAGLDPSAKLLDDINFATFLNQSARITNVIVKGLPGVSNPVDNSNIAAWLLSSVTLRDVQTAVDANPKFGLAAHTLTSYTRLVGKTTAGRLVRRTGPGNQVDPPLELDQAGDFLVRLF